jgi:hypothetical protein
MALTNAEIQVRKRNKKTRAGLVNKRFDIYPENHEEISDFINKLTVRTKRKRRGLARKGEAHE